jgi:aryl-alcohol dehydrogenase-like predicted oxidoreductase
LARLKVEAMKYFNIPHTDLNPSCLALGTNRFGTVIDQTHAFALLDAFVEVGGNFIDTALIYADWIPDAPKSASEKTIGQWLKYTNNRDRMVLATKGGHPELSTMHLSRMSKADITLDIDASLSNMQTDVIDLYWLHRDATSKPVAELIDTLNQQVQAGKIRYFGCSNWHVERILAANEYANDNDLQGFVASQPWWSLAQPNRGALSYSENMVVFGLKEEAFHRPTGLAVMPYSAQARGYFSKLDKLGANGLGETDQASFSNETNAHRWQQVKQLAEKYGVPVSHVALSYLTSQPFVTIPIIGCRTLDQLDDSTKAANLLLTQEEITYLTDPPADHAE